MKKAIRLLCAMVLLMGLLPMVPKMAIEASDVIGADNYNKEALELRANEGHVLTPDTHQYYTYNTSESLVFEGWGVTLLGYDWGVEASGASQYVKHTLQVKAMAGYHLPSASAQGVYNPYASVSNAFAYDYERNAFVHNSDGTGTLTFYTALTNVNKTSEAAMVVAPKTGTSLDYRAEYRFVSLTHYAKDLESQGPNMGQNFSMKDTGQRIYMVKKGHDLKVYAVDKDGFKPAYTNHAPGEGYDFSSSSDYTNRYTIYKNVTRNAFTQIGYVTSNFYVQVLRNGAWSVEAEYDYYNVDNVISMADIARTFDPIEGFRLMGFTVQVLNSTNTQWETTTLGVDGIFETKARDFNVQWTQPSDFQKRQNTLFIAPIYAKEYQVNYVNNDENNTIYKDSNSYIETEMIDLATLEQTGFSKEGHEFLGWNTAADGTGSMVQEDFIMGKEHITLYAQWNVVDEEAPIVPIPPTIVEPTVPTTPTPPTPTPVQPTVLAPQTTTPIVPVPLQEVVEEPATPQTQGEVEAVDEIPTPKSKGATQGHWALVNLICTLGTMVLALILVASTRKKEEDEGDAQQSADEEESVYVRSRWIKVWACLVAIVSIVLFIISEDLTLTMAWVDQWTMSMALLFIAQVCTVVVGKAHKREQKPRRTH